MKKKILYKKIKKIFLPVLVFVSFFALCFSVMYANADTFVNQDAPFIIQGTATNNNTSIDPVGDVAYLVEKRGHSEVVNGEIVDADGKDLVCIGRQVWNEHYVFGYFDASGQFIEDDVNSRLCSEELIPVVPNRQYYFYSPFGLYCYSYDINGVFVSELDFNSATRLFTTPVNCHYISFSSRSNVSSYENNITLSLWYDDEDGYDEYYPFQILTQVNTGTEVLRSAGNAYDVKTSNGVIVRNIDSVVFSDLDWSLYSTGIFRCSIDNIANGINLLNEVYVGRYSTSNYSIYVEDGYLYLYDDQFSSVDSLVNSRGDTFIYYQVVNSSQEQGTSFNQVLSVDDFGSMYWLDDNGDLITIPQGNRVTYVYSFVYAWTEPIWRIFPEVFKDLGGNVLKFIKDGFVNLFVNQVEVDGVIEYQPSEVCYFVFAIMGIALIFGLTYYIVNMLRRSR